MQDQDVPPVEEGETGGGVDAVPRAAAIRKAGPVAIISATAFTPHPWITATARHWPAATMALAPAGIGLVLRPIIRRPNPSRCPCARMPASRIFGFVDDLFFQAKIQETARKLNVKVEFVKTEQDLTERIKLNGEEKPSLIIFDLNHVSAKPLSLIPKLKSKLKKTSVIGFLSHVQGDLKQKAHEVGCDMVLPRSAFSQNLPQLLRRHGAAEEPITG